MRAGQLRKQIVIQQRAATADSVGQQTTTWTDFWATFGGVRAPRAYEQFIAQGLQAAITHIVTIRYHAGITAQMRVVLEGRNLDITGVIDKDERHVEMDLYCVEGLSQG